MMFWSLAKVGTTKNTKYTKNNEAPFVLFKAFVVIITSQPRGQ
ncbi:MAG: hypothetical protein WD894_19795 [Pirellulales bacterium]